MRRGKMSKDEAPGQDSCLSTERVPALLRILSPALTLISVFQKTATAAAAARAFPKVSEWFPTVFEWFPNVFLVGS